MTENDSFSNDSFKRSLRDAILTTIDSCNRPLTAPELYEGARSRVPHIAFATIDRAIYDLVVTGLLSPIAPPGTSPRYARPNQARQRSKEPPEHHLDDHQSNGSTPVSLCKMSDRPHAKPGAGVSQIPSASEQELSQHEPTTGSPLPTLPKLTHRDERTSNDFTTHLAAIRPALEAIHRNDLPRPSCIVFPPNMDRTVLRNLPFRIRTWNCLNNAGLFEGHSVLTVSELLSLRNFGNTSLRDFLLVIETHLHKCIRDAPHQAETTSTHDTKDRLSDATAMPPTNQIISSHDRSTPDPVGKLFAAASELHGYTTLVELFSSEIVRLASAIGALDDLKKFRINEMISPHDSHSAIVLDETRKLYTELSPSQRTVLDHRILKSPRTSLKKIGLILGVTRQRVQQVYAKVKKALDNSFGVAIQEISSVLRDQLGPIAYARDVDPKIQHLFPDDGTSIPVLARHMTRVTVGYTRTLQGIYLTDPAYRVVQYIRSVAPRFSEDGIIDQALLKDSLPDHDWQRHWPLLLKCCSFYDLFGLLAIRDSNRARTKAALLSIGVPATREEIAELCGLSISRVGSYLSGFTGVVRADKSRWGLSEWIDDEYEGIEAEIIQRIDEGGGVTSTNRLIEELPRKFGVSASSVSAYLQRPTFSVRGNHVTLADDSTSQIRLQKSEHCPTCQMNGRCRRYFAVDRSADSTCSQR